MRAQPQRLQPACAGRGRPSGRRSLARRLPQQRFCVRQCKGPARPQLLTSLRQKVKKELQDARLGWASMVGRLSRVLSDPGL